ncbi:hypothetical protein IMAU60210_00650 [Lactobacillus helveticus]|nr:hypothetical protein [Lactobacillus helveticus]
MLNAIKRRWTLFQRLFLVQLKSDWRQNNELFRTIT